MPDALGRLRHLRALREEAVARFCAQRDLYTARLIRAEARIRRIEAQLRAAVASASVAALKGGARARADQLARGAHCVGKGRNAGRVATSKHPFPHRCNNVSEWAARHGVSRSTVKSWYATRGKYRAAIPMKWARVLLQEYDVPLESWPNGIVDDRRTD